MEQRRLLGKNDFKFRLYDTVNNLTILFLVLAMMIALAPLIYVGFLLVYFIFIFVVSVFLILFTMGLIFTVKDNIVVKMWRTLDGLNVDKAVSFQATIGPVVLVLLGITLTVTIVGIFTKLSKTKTKPIVTSIFAGLAFVFLLLMLLMGGGVK